MIALSTCAAIATSPAPAAAADAHGATPALLRLAASRARHDDRALVRHARALRACLRTQPGNCRRARRALQSSGTRLAAAERTLARLVRLTEHNRHPHQAWLSRRAPATKVLGQTLVWNHVGYVTRYVVARQVPSEAPQYVVVKDTSFTPPPVPGVTVAYSVRTAVQGSRWAKPLTIPYPVNDPTPDPQTAPIITVSSQTLRWTPIANVSTYVLVTVAPGHAPQYSVVSGTSVTPPPAPGSVVHYSVRTAVEGSAWSPEVSVTYPPDGTTNASAPVALGGRLGTTTFQPGLNSGANMTYDVPGAAMLGARVVRVDFAIGTPASAMEGVIGAYAAKGIKVLALATFTGRMPSPAEARNLAGWAAAYGPGGSFWSGKGYPASVALSDIEFGNETSYGYQYHDNAGEPSYTERAETYALRFKEAAEAIAAAHANVGLLAQADDWTGDWVNGMFAAVPNLAQYVAGWTIHPYNQWQSRLQGLIDQTAAHGASASIPIEITEWGIETDNGRCLQAGYESNHCVSYQQAAEILRSTVHGIREMLGSRLSYFMVYQVRDQRVSGTSTELEGYFGALQHELQPKGAYTPAVAELMAGR